MQVGEQKAKCKRCGQEMVEDAWICIYCGRLDWSTIAAGTVLCTILVAIGAFVCKPGFWRWLWIGTGIAFGVSTTYKTIQALTWSMKWKPSGFIKSDTSNKSKRRRKKPSGFVKSDTSNKCKRCSKKTLGTAEYVKKVEQKGWTVHALTQKPQPPSGFVGDISKLVDLENQRGFRCTKCGHVYCMDCLFSHAPDHSNGGKACFKCGGAFEVLD